MGPASHKRGAIAGASSNREAESCFGHLLGDSSEFGYQTASELLQVCARAHLNAEPYCTVSGTEIDAAELPELAVTVTV
jgi:hypothetical protein